MVVFVRICLAITLLGLNLDSVFSFSCLPWSHVSSSVKSSLSNRMCRRSYCTEFRQLKVARLALKDDKIDSAEADGNLTRILLPDSMVGKGRARGMDDSDEPDDEIDETVESKGRRLLVGFAFFLGAAGWAKVQFEGELNEIQAGIRSYSPDAADLFSRVVWGDKVTKYVKKGTSLPERRPLQGRFASDLSQCILKTALETRVITDDAALLKEERALASKAASFFAGSTPIDNSQDWNSVWGSQQLVNTALYSRMRSLYPNLPSPFSRKAFLRALGKRVLSDKVLGPEFDLFTFSVSDPVAESNKWIAGLMYILRAYEEQGYAVCSLGQKGVGELDKERWEETKEGALTIFVQNIALMDAAQVLAGESLNDLAEALLPTCVIVAYFEQIGITCDAEDYYLSSTYTRNPADYRPDSLVIQCNLSVGKGAARKELG
jgi:hypothetical protein